MLSHTKEAGASLVAKGGPASSAERTSAKARKQKSRNTPDILHHSEEASVSEQVSRAGAVGGEVSERPWESG